MRGVIHNGYKLSALHASRCHGKLERTPAGDLCAGVSACYSGSNLLQRHLPCILWRHSRHTASCASQSQPGTTCFSEGMAAVLVRQPAAQVLEYDAGQERLGVLAPHIQPETAVAAVAGAGLLEAASCCCRLGLEWFCHLSSFRCHQTELQYRIQGLARLLGLQRAAALMSETVVAMHQKLLQQLHLHCLVG